LITDLLREKLSAYIATLINHTNAEGDVGLGGNSTSPAATSLDVPLTVTTSQYEATRSDDNVIEVKLSIEGSNITGKVIREASFGGNDGSTDEMLARVNFAGVGPFAANEILEIFLVVEVE
tara:strand:- start:45 stop:407 length:363 start_codon:yes stop_codon:yes gene_type:complete